MDSAIIGAMIAGLFASYLVWTASRHQREIREVHESVKRRMSEVSDEIRDHRRTLNERSEFTMNNLNRLDHDVEYINAALYHLGVDKETVRSECKRRVDEFYSSSDQWLHRAVLSNLSDAEIISYLNGRRKQS